jgi:4-hydroxybenzoate polyprenyltransferase
MIFQKIRQFASFFRISNIFITLISIIGFLYFINESYFLTKNSILLIIIIIFSLIAGNIANDIFDIEIDKINKPQRLLPSRVISIKTAWYIYGFFLIVAFILMFWFKGSAIFLIILNNFLLIMYARFFKRTILLGNLIVSFLAGSVFLLFGIVYKNLLAGFLFFWFAFWVNLFREIIKDIEDIEGDQKNNVKTYPVVFGIKNSLKILRLFITISYIGFFMGFVFEIFNSKFLIALHFSFWLPLFILRTYANIKFETVDFSRLSIALKFLMISGLLTLLVLKNDFTIFS